MRLPLFSGASHTGILMSAKNCRQCATDRPEAGLSRACAKAAQPQRTSGQTNWLQQRQNHYWRRAKHSGLCGRCEFVANPVLWAWRWSPSFSLCFIQSAMASISRWPCYCIAPEPKESGLSNFATSRIGPFKAKQYPFSWYVPLT